MGLITTIREFLESSTIHGLVHISAAKTQAARTAWVAIVVICFAMAISMITSSYDEWQESPLSTTITTHPIKKLQFPAVSVCPPRGSNTALNQVLEKMKGRNFTGKERQKLINMSREIFSQGQTKMHAKQMSELLSPENIRSIVNKQAVMPSVDKDTNIITLTSRELEGSFSTPGFRDSECRGDFFNRPHLLHYEIVFPPGTKDALGDGNLIISVQTKDEWSFSWDKPLQLYNKKMKLNMTEAENFCVSQGKHLASVTSIEEEKEVGKLMFFGVSNVWLGGKRMSTEDSWQWLDGRKWQFEGNWEEEDGIKEANKCLSLQKKGDVTSMYSHGRKQSVRKPTILYAGMQKTK